MKRVLPVLFVLLWAFGLSSAQDATPKMIIEQPVFDAGVVIRTEAPLDHVFRIKNTGNAELKILDVKPGCGCTVAKFDKVIPPGSEGKIYASLDLSHLKGPVQKSIDIQSNDPKHPSAVVVLKATIKSVVDIEPTDQLRFVVKKGSLTNGELFLIPDSSVKLLDPIVDSTLIAAKLTPDKNGRQKLSVELKRSDIIGTHATEIRIPVQGPIKEVTVPVVINVQGPLQVNPRMVSFVLKGFPEEVLVSAATEVKQAPDASAIIVEKVAAGRKLQVLNESDGWYQVITFEKAGSGKDLPMQRVGWIPVASVKTTKGAQIPGAQQVSIEISKGQKFQVLDVSSTLPVVKVVGKPSVPNPNTYQLSVSLLKVDQSKKGNTRGEIVVKTDNPDQPQLKIPVFVNVL